MSSDGIASFATFVYGNDGLETLNNLIDDKIVGFDAGDGIRSATVLSPGLSSLQELQSVNIFRIDGRPTNQILLGLLRMHLLCRLLHHHSQCK